MYKKLLEHVLRMPQYQLSLFKTCFIKTAENLFQISFKINILHFSDIIIIQSLKFLDKPINIFQNLLVLLNFIQFVQLNPAYTQGKQYLNKYLKTSA